MKEKQLTVGRVRVILKNWPSLSEIIFWLCVISSAILLSGCATASDVPPPTNVCPVLEPLSGQTLRASQPNSTDLLNRADSWLVSSDQLLSSVTSSSNSSANSSTQTDD